MKIMYTNFCNNYITLIQKEYNVIIDFKINDEGFEFIYNNIKLCVSDNNFKDMLYLQITDKIEGNFDKIMVKSLTELLKIV
jgi:hypothetical protein